MESGSGVFTFDGDVFLDCLGEVVRSVIAAPYTYRRVLTPTGDSLYVEHWNNKEITGTLTGLTSGLTWNRVDNVSPLVDRSMGGGMTMYTFKGTFVPVSTGPTIQAHERYHVSRDAKGNTRVDMYEFRCWLK
jgi:hypothetical protein